MTKTRYKSRATRAADQASEWRSAAEQLRDLIEDEDPNAEGVVPDDIKEAYEKDLVKSANAIIDLLSSSELEMLAEEMRTWADNYPENLQSTDKYSSIDEAASTLENIGIDNIGHVDASEDIEGVAEELDSAADELEAIEFPGMFG